MGHLTSTTRPIVLASRGASDAGGAASQAAAFLARHVGATVLATPAAGASSPVAAARAIGPEEADAVIVLAAQAGRAVHARSLPVRTDALSAARLPGWHLLVTVPAYAAAPPQPAAALGLVREALRLLGRGADTAQLVEDAEAWRRGAHELTRHDPRVGALVRAWEADATDQPPHAEDIAADAERHLRWVAGN